MIQYHPLAGLTLIELMVVIVVLSVLAMLAWPAYTDSIHKSRRADARVALLDAAQRLERCQTRHQSYDHEECPIPFTSPEGFYRIIDAEPRGPLTFRLRATPIGPQAGDAQACTFLELDHRGQRTAAGHAHSACW